MKKNKLTIIILTPGEPRTLLPDTRKRFEQFLKLHTMVKEADVKLSYGSSMRTSRVCEVYLKTGTKNSFAREETDSFEESIRKVLLKLQQQLTTTI